jgi:hypothetical protein
MHIDAVILFLQNTEIEKFRWALTNGDRNKKLRSLPFAGVAAADEDDMIGRFWYCVRLER